MAHNIIDSNAHFKIDAHTRKIKYDSSAKLVLVQYDHNSERITFEMPRYIEGHDMSLCNKVEIHYLNFAAAEKASGVYPVDDLQISPVDDSVVICSWLVSRNATGIAGALNFVIRFACLTGDLIDYDWHTEICSDVVVARGIDNGEAVVEEYSDVLKSWEQKLCPARIGEVTLLASNWQGTESPYAQVVTVAGATANSQVDITPSVEQLAIFHEKDIAFVTENDDGVVTVYAVGQKPTNDYTIQVTITEVDV